MDPNLEKIRDANIKLIKVGRVAVPILQAQHYLFTILGQKAKKQIDIELQNFAQHIKHIARRT